jgi:uncharacterized protein (TIGR03437 family)
MIGEIPLPACVGSDSPFAAAIANARAELNARLTPTTGFKATNLPVQIRGVGFFDFLHGQTGVAPNGIELHPVLDVIFNPTATIPTITSVNTAGGFPDIAQNGWIEIKGAGLAPASVGSTGTTWSSAPEFAVGRMPTQLSNVSVKVNGKPAYVYFISENQINVLTPLDNSQGSAQIVVTNGTISSTPFAVTMRAVAPSFLLFGSSRYIAATHADGSLLGPASMSSPGYAFTPAQPGETIVLYAVGFGLPTTSLTEGSSSQAGLLPDRPAIQIGGVPATVQFAGVISPGLYQFNVVVPAGTATGDSTVSASYGGVGAALGSLVSVQR